MIAIGLDYGTTNSLITVFQENMGGVIVEKQVTSSVKDHGEYIRSPKRLLSGRSFENKKEAIASYISECVIKLFSGLETQFAGEDVRLAITVPNSFSDIECLFLKKSIAAAVANHIMHSEEKIDIIPEPVAAALFYAYCTRNSVTQESYVVVSDMGGGTTDLAVVKIENIDDRLNFEVICVQHNANLGGDDIDKRIAQFVMPDDDENFNLLNACRALKELLSMSSKEQDTVAVLNNKGEYESNEIVEISLRRCQLESIVNDLISPKLKEMLYDLKVDFENYLTKQGYSETEIKHKLKNAILLPVGGSSQIPLVQKIVKDVFNTSDIFTLNTELATAKFDSVCRGAAIYAAYMGGLIRGELSIAHRTPHRYAIRCSDFRLNTCVEKTMNDGDYTSKWIPNSIEKKGKNKVLSWDKIEVFQGGTSDIIDQDTIPIKKIDITDTIYAKSSVLDENEIELTISIRDGRVKKIAVKVAGGKTPALNEDYYKEFLLEDENE